MVLFRYGQLPNLIAKASWESVALIIALSLISSRGFGSTLVFTAFVGLALGTILYDTVRSKQHGRTTTTLVALLAIVFYWPVVYLHGFWGFLTSYTSHFKSDVRCGISPAFLFLWLIQFTAVGSWTHEPIIGIVTFCTATFFLSLVNQHIRSVLAIGCLVATVGSLLGSFPKTVTIEYFSELEKAYSHGPLLRKAIDGKLVPPGMLYGDVGITSLFFGESEKRAQRTLVLLEHDVAPSSRKHPILPLHNLSQEQPWSGNQFFGDQYILAAIAADGFWASNLGGRLKPSGRILLASNRYHGGGRFEPIVLETGELVYIQDSDSFVDRLVNYQVSTVHELVHGRKLLRIINGFFAFSILICSTWIANFIFAIGIAILLVVESAPVSGDVRLLIEPGSPHELSRGSGVMRSLVDAGYSYLKGDTDAKVLIIGPGRSARVQPSEKIVLASSNSKIFVEDDLVIVDGQPLGSVDGITDARTLLINGRKVGVSTHIGDLTIIGTDSPAKQNWARWLK